MMRLLSVTLCALCCQASNAQFELHGTVLWPDGSAFELPASAVMMFRDSNNGCVLGAYTFQVSNGVINLDGYHFINPLIHGDLEVSITASVEPRARVTVLDLLKLQKHILGLTPLTNALEVYSADVTASGGVSVLDLVQMRKMVLGLITEWPDKQAITFFVRTDTDPPAIGSTLSEQLTIPWSTGTQSITVDFWAVKTGDVH